MLRVCLTIIGVLLGLGFGLCQDGVTGMSPEEGMAQPEVKRKIEWGVWTLALLVGCVLSYAAGRKSGAGLREIPVPVHSKSEETPELVDSVGDKVNRMVPSAAKSILAKIQSLEHQGEDVMATEELNVFLGLGAAVSSESKRAKRAQFIRDVNRVYQMNHGKDMIVREKDVKDRRRTIYVIRPHSSSA